MGEVITNFQDSLDQGAPSTVRTIQTVHDKIIECAKRNPSKLLLGKTGLSAGMLINTPNCELYAILCRKITLNDMQMCGFVPEVKAIVELMDALRISLGVES